MKLPIKRRRELKRRAKKARRSKRRAIRDVVLRWDNGVMPYKYVTGHYSKLAVFLCGTTVPFSIAYSSSVMSSNPVQG